MKYTICDIEITKESALLIAKQYRDICLQKAQEFEIRFGKKHFRTRKEYKDYAKAIELVNEILIQ